MPRLKLNTSNLKLFVVMGVSGCGKSTVARALADALDGVFIEGDDLHSAANKARMSAGTPLTDDDRWPWYDRIIESVRSSGSDGTPVVLSCSALKKVYRDHLRDAFPDLRFIYLKGDQETIRGRLEKRTGHFMSATLLDSQFATLEEPQGALTLDIALPPHEMVTRALALLGRSAAV